MAGELRLRAPALHFTAEPDAAGRTGVEYLDDAVLIVRDGCVHALLATDDARANGLDLTTCEAFPDRLLFPGCIDAHVHYAQLDAMGCYGADLLEWLERCAFPAEARLNDAGVAARVAERYLDWQLANGITTALVFATSAPGSVNALCGASRVRGMRMIVGKVLMDRHAPQELLDTAEGGIVDSRALIERWHGSGRLGYAITPRFAPSCSVAQLAAAGALKREHPDVWVQTHLSEQLGEIAWVKRLFPEALDYLDVYDRAGLLGERTVLAHGIHLTDRELKRIAATGSKLAFCPSSNLHLGSGLLDLDRVRAAGVELALATDVGGGTRLSMFAAAADAHRVARLTGQSFHPFEAFYRMTLGNARALGLDTRIGNFTAGKEADFVLLDAGALMPRVVAAGAALADRLFTLSQLADERVVARTYVNGELVWKR